ncbi:glycosyltransferase family 1 protein [Paractinoplanes ferrugineus]|uniref:GDP-mannose-dependent alpha-(1-6)-phosphatidylinositol dimannoside mannosyltransferase n=1 Tax=Paractinoplanes ferrugineus TaxID=113564 RepID=A0A919J6S8_9ACTN|nr:glycosyltransferase [Actinoplanes ferrugineus]GIE14053.1 GDP-mannose-dependent alpha-(1-6)-phosphatidylinositol dimannoside mannosyltransferase [Actinoplanes ferrugineus]
MRIVRVANYVAPRSGGLKTALRHLGAGYQAAGHESVLIIPGEKESVTDTEQGRTITLPGPYVPGVGGYRVLLDRRRLAATLRILRPDRIEISDRTTLRWLGRWARRHDVPSMMVSHESLDGLLRLFGPASGRRVADVLNGRTAADHDKIVCTTRWASAEFERIGRPVTRVPLGVDLDRFRPDRRSESMRSRWAGPDDVLLLHCGRLSPEKKPRRSLAALEGLRHQGVRAVLVVAGAGPLRNALQEEAAARGLPVRFLGHLGDPLEVAALQASADVAIAPGPIETFGLSALETLASGTPVVVSSESALPEVIGSAGLAAAGEGPGYVSAVLDLLSHPEAARRQAARTQAEKFPWSASVDGFLAAHGAASGAHRSSGDRPGADRVGVDRVGGAETLGRDAGRA